MDNIFYEGEVIWAMTDANGHLRHSAYADFAAQSRWTALKKTGFVNKTMEYKIAPILFREESVFLKELRLGESVRVSVEVTKMRSDYSRFTMKSVVYRASDNTKSAEVIVDGAWINLETRKLAVLPDELRAMLDHVPRSPDIIIEQSK